MEEIDDTELAKRWGVSKRKIRNMCNLDLDAYFCPTKFYQEDFKRLGKAYIILYNLSLISEEIRPRVLNREKSKPGNPNLKKKSVM